MQGAVPRAMPRVRRWRRRLAGLVLLAGLLALAALLRAPPERLTAADGATVRVMDGDSLHIGERIVRIEGIDAVELHQACRAGDDVQWSCGLEARAALHALVGRGGLACESDAKDRYGRAVARCVVTGVPDVGRALVEQGWAIHLDRGGGGRYRDAEAAAYAARRGIWRGDFERPADWRATHPRGN